MPNHNFDPYTGEPLNIRPAGNPGMKGIAGWLTDLSPGQRIPRAAFHFVNVLLALCALAVWLYTIYRGFGMGIYYAEHPMRSGILAIALGWIPPVALLALARILTESAYGNVNNSKAHDGMRGDR